MVQHESSIQCFREAIAVMRVGFSDPTPEGGDSWDEGKGGVAWIENEFSFFYELWTLINVSWFPPWSVCEDALRNIQTVEGAIVYLDTNFFCGEAFRAFVEEGGTGNRFYWSIVKKRRDGCAVSERKKMRLARSFRLRR